jgi:Ca-activated chloride channel family protein
MSFLWPQYLWMLAAAPALVWAYIALLNRRKRALNYASLRTIKEALGPGSRWRRHVPPALLLLAVCAALVAAARPVAMVTLPSEGRMIVLAMDVSRSMLATDVKPDRITAAKAAAKTFIQEVPANIKVAIISFAGTASVVQAPTYNREDLLAAIDRFDLQRHTAIGSGILAALATIFPDEGIVVEQGYTSGWGTGEPAAKRDAPIARAPKDDAPKKEFKPVPPGSYSSASIILLTDGRRTTGPDPLDSARKAADRGVKVHTVGFGSAAGGPVAMDGFAMYMAFDEETLKAIASLTHADYFKASSSEDLSKVYSTLNSKFMMERKESEITALLAAAAAALAVVAGALSLVWFNRFA